VPRWIRGFALDGRRENAVSLPASRDVSEPEGGVVVDVEAGGVGRRIEDACVGVRGLGDGDGDIVPKFVVYEEVKPKWQLIDGRVGGEVGTFASRSASGGEEVGEDRRGDEDSGDGFTGV
jgi:hypothetical protein